MKSWGINVAVGHYCARLSVCACVNFCTIPWIGLSETSRPWGFFPLTLLTFSSLWWGTLAKNTSNTENIIIFHLGHITWHWREEANERSEHDQNLQAEKQAATFANSCIGRQRLMCLLLLRPQVLFVCGCVTMASKAFLSWFKKDFVLFCTSFSGTTDS